MKATFMLMRPLFFAAALLLPVSAMAQQSPTVQSQADAAALQATRMVTLLAGQITADQETIAAQTKQIGDLQAKLAAAPKSEPAKKD